MKRKSVVAILGLLCGGLLLGGLLWLLRFDPDTVDIETLRALGVPLWIAGLLFMILSGGLGLPPVLVIIPVGAVWSFPWALLLALCGGLGASVLGFLLSRHAFRDRVASRIPPKILKYEQRLETHAFSTVIVLRLLFYLFPPINWMLGLSRISLPVFALGTFIGMLPATLVYLWAGQGLIGFLLTLSPQQSLILLAAALAALLLWLSWVVKS